MVRGWWSRLVLFFYLGKMIELEFFVIKDFASPINCVFILVFAVDKYHLFKDPDNIIEATLMNVILVSMYSYIQARL